MPRLVLIVCADAPEDVKAGAVHYGDGRYFCTWCGKRIHRIAW